MAWLCCFVHACMRTAPARPAQRSATSGLPFSACGSGPGLRTVARSERSQSQIKPGIAEHGQGCWDPIPWPSGRLPWRVAVGPISRLQRRMQGWRRRKSKYSWLALGGATKSCVALAHADAMQGVQEPRERAAWKGCMTLGADFLGSFGSMYLDGMSRCPSQADLTRWMKSKRQAGRAQGPPEEEKMATSAEMHAGTGGI